MVKDGVINVTKEDEILDSVLTNSVEVRKNHFVRMDRRTFLKMAGVAAAAIALNPKLVDTATASTLVPQVPFPGKNILKYIDSLPVFGPAGPIPRVNGNNPITVTLKPFSQQVLSTGTILAPGMVVGPAVGLTNVWAYDLNGITNYPTVTIEATKGTPTHVTYINNLTPDLYKYLTVDQTLHWADPLMNMQNMPMAPYQGPVPVVTHLHGAEVPPQVDGGPDAWWTPDGLQGHAYFSEPGAAINAAKYTYPNVQESTTLFFHDHALGVTRLNVFAGLVGFYFIRDALETAVSPPLPAGPNEIEMAIQDRMFDTAGQWFFPDLGLNPTVHPFWIPEFFGDAIVVNGKTWPFLAVQPRRYRFRLVNGSNARFYRFDLGPKLLFWQIGTDGGLLDSPVAVNQLLLAPGERADVIIDFTAFAGKNIIMTNSAKAPFPAGKNPDPKTTGQIIQFRVSPTLVPDSSFNPAAAGATLRSLANQIVRLVNPLTGTLAINVTPTKKRQLTLNEVMGPLGPLEVILNNTRWTGMWPGTAPMSPPRVRTLPGGITDFTPFTVGGVTTYYSEIVQEGTTEVWEIINLTRDAHPIHLHLVQFQLLNRQPFNKTQYLAAYNALFPGGTFDGVLYAPGAYIPVYGPPSNYNVANTGGYVGGNPDILSALQGTPIPPNPNEAGWKDTVVAYPGEVTRIAVRFAPLDKPITDPNLYYPFNPNGGHGYVWHCHIIDHEDNEMMRPYSVTPATVAAPTVVITAPATGTVNTAITLTGAPTYAPGLTGNIVWSGVDPITGLPISFVPDTINPDTVAFTPVNTGTYTITATVKDSRGNTGIATATIIVA